jgi:hypothetical protein
MNDAQAGSVTAVQAPTSTGWRVFRASVFAVLATQLAALGHVMGGGLLPDPAVLLTIAVFLGGSLSGLATRRRTVTQIFAVLAASQLVFHADFEVTATHAGHGAGGPLDTPRMLVFHLFAALAAAALMAGGESTLFRLFAALHRVLVRVRIVQAVVLAPGWTAVITGSSGAVRLRSGVLSQVSRRGPPLSA